MNADGTCSAKNTATQVDLKLEPVKVNGNTDKNGFEIIRTVYYVPASNESGFEFPATGGNGTIRYIAVGVLMMAVSLGTYIGYKNRRRCERRRE